MPKSAKRKERRQEQKASYLSYKHRSALNVGLDEDGRANRQPEIRPDSGYMCAKCRPILSRYEGIYKSLIHQRSELNKRKHANPRPKRPDFAHYRDLEWIRENLFDPMGNYLFCCSCIRASLKISKQRIAHQRAIKQQESQEPLRDVAKAEVEEQCLSAYVVMPAALEVAFKERVAGP